MKNYLEALKMKQLVDNRDLWITGRIEKEETLGAPCNNIGVVMQSMNSSRVLSISENELIESVLIKNELKKINTYSKNKSKNVSINKGFLGLSYKIIITDKEGNKTTFVVKMNDHFLETLKNMFQ